MNRAADRETALEARGLCRTFYDGEKEIRVLAGLDLVVARQESVAVIGESGVGKSTLLHLLGALDSPDSGDVVLAGNELFELPARELAAVRNRAMGFVFQFHYLLGDFDAVENVMMPLLVGGASRTKARGRAVEMLEKVGLAARLRHRPGELSGGEQQRVAVARAVVTRPQVLLADEPTGNLDPHTAEDVHQVLRDVQAEAGCSMVVATHNSAMAATLDRTLMLESGRLTEVARQ